MSRNVAGGATLTHCAAASAPERGTEAGGELGNHESDHRVAACFGATAIAALLCSSQLAEVDLDAMTGLGLLSVLPISLLAGLGLLSVCFGWALSLPRQHRWLLALQLFVLVLVLHGVTNVLEPEARCAVAWIHAGFVEFIDRAQTTVPALDARWSWPGFFATAAFLIGSGDRDVLSPVLAAAPVVNNMLILLAMWLLLRSIRMSWQAKWLAGWLCAVLNWVGQDYFSPQAFAFLLYLFFIAILLRWFGCAERAGRPGHRDPASTAWQRIWVRKTRGEWPSLASSQSERAVLLAVVIGLFVAATVSHQLTPFVMVMSTAALVAVRRCSLTGLPLLLGAVLAGWISYMTVPYWSGHLDSMVGQVGDVGSTVSSSVVARAVGGTAEHQLVGHVRLLSAALLLSLAGWGLLRRRRRGIDDRVLLVLTVVPFGLVLMQSYGGEIAFRVYLFVLVPASALAAMCFFPDPVARPSLSARCAVVACLVALLPVFFVTRYGNELYEQTTRGALEAVQSAYADTPVRGTLLYTSTNVHDAPFIPVGYRDVERIRFAGIPAPIDPADIGPVLAAMRHEGAGASLITTGAQEAYLIEAAGYPVGWGADFRRSLAAAPDVRVTFENADAAVYRLAEPSGGVPAVRSGLDTGPDVRSTPWTPLGAALLFLLIGVLGVRELIRGDRTRRQLRPLTMAAVPLLIGFALVVAERFVLLAA